MPKTFLFFLVPFSFIFCIACGAEDDSSAVADTDIAQDPEISFVQACNLSCEYGHDDPEGCPADLSESLNACLQACAQESTMKFGEGCEAVGIQYYQCTWELTFTCSEGQDEPIPSNLTDCADESGEWNACLLGG